MGFASVESLRRARPRDGEMGFASVVSLRSPA